MVFIKNQNSKLLYGQRPEQFTVHGFINYNSAHYGMIFSIRIYLMQSLRLDYSRFDNTSGSDWPLLVPHLPAEPDPLRSWSQCGHPREVPAFQHV